MTPFQNKIRNKTDLENVGAPNQIRNESDMIQKLL